MAWTWKCDQFMHQYLFIPIYILIFIRRLQNWENQSYWSMPFTTSEFSFSIYAFLASLSLCESVCVFEENLSHLDSDWKIFCVGWLNFYMTLKVTCAHSFLWRSKKQNKIDIFIFWLQLLCVFAHHLKVYTQWMTVLVLWPIHYDSD